MNLIIAIAAGGASGALLRYWLSNATYAALGRGFPYGTLAVNLLGCLLMGFLTIWLMERTSAGPVMRAFLLIGLLGAFTTFSTFSIETMTLIESGQLTKAVLNMLLSVVLCVTATACGLLIGRQL
jgi:CrcB protein